MNPIKKNNWLKKVQKDLKGTEITDRIILGRQKFRGKLLNKEDLEENKGLTEWSG